MSLPAATRERLIHIGALEDEAIDLAEAALAISAVDRPGVSVEPYRRHLEKLVAEVSAYAGSMRGDPGIDGRIEALSHVVSRRYGYCCNPETYEELDAANLMRVIDSRRGLPVVLGILYIHVCRALDWDMVGLDFPSRFLVRLDFQGQRRILDPAVGLTALGPADLRALLKAVSGNDAELTPADYAPMANRAVLYRMQNNVKIRHLKAERMEEALKTFSVDVKGKTILDVGASTGGFTDCLLQHGTGRVIALDVGYGQFHWSLRTDPRVHVLERTNARYLKPDDLKEGIDGAVIDVSFISLKLVVPPVSECLTRHAFIIALIKPQFEVGKGQVGKGGVVREPALHRRVIGDLSRFFEGLGWTVIAQTPSPILGPKGNREFLIHLER